MKRIACLILLTALSSPASARGSYSFVVHGHRVHIPAHCRSLSCVSVSGVNLHRGRRDADDVATVNDPAPAPAPTFVPVPAAPPAPAPVIAPPAPPPVSGPQIVQTAPPLMRAPSAPVAPSQPVQARPSAVPAPTLAAVPPAPPSVGFEQPRSQPSPVARPAQTTLQERPQERIQERPQDRPVAAPPVSQQVARSQQSEEDDDSPIGDWQTEARNGLVRIEACGPSLCGYMLDANTKAKGETILVNMKPKKSNQWAGGVYSRSSGNSYYGTMTLKEGNSLRVEACALGSFFCSGNTWTRFEDSRSVRPGDFANTRQDASPSPRS